MLRRYCVSNGSESDSDSLSESYESSSSSSKIEELILSPDLQPGWHLENDYTNYMNYFTLPPMFDFVLSRLDLKSTFILTCTHTGFNILLQELLPSLQVLEFIANNRVDKANGAFKKNQELMFKSIGRMDVNGKFLKISPLQLSIDLRDTSILYKCLSEIKYNYELLCLFMHQAHMFLTDINYSYNFKFNSLTQGNRSPLESLWNILLDVQTAFSELQLIKLTNEAVKISLPYLDIQSKCRLSATSKNFHTFFQPHLSDTKLLHFTIKANWKKIHELSVKNPESIFKTQTDRNQEGDIITISPLQYACMVYDTHARRIFFEVIKHNKEWVATFIQQASEGKSHLNLNLLFAAYDNYQLKYEAFLKKTMSREELLISIAQLGKIQSEILPWHLLRHIANPKLSWSFYKSFLSQELDKQLTYACSVKKATNKYHFHSMRLIIAELKNGSALCRGIETEATLLKTNFADFSASSLDLDKRLIEEYLFKKRTEHQNDMSHIRTEPESQPDYKFR